MVKNFTSLSKSTNYATLSGSSVAIDHINLTKQSVVKMSKSLATEEYDETCESATSFNEESSTGLKVSNLNLCKPGKLSLLTLRAGSSIKSVRKRSNTRRRAVDIKTVQRKLYCRSNQKLQANENLLQTTSKTDRHSKEVKEASHVSSVANMKSFHSFKPTIKDLTTVFSSDVTICSFCHLPAHFLPGLGDLFGPYRPSYDEILEQYDASTSSHNLHSMASEICVDPSENTCYLTTSCFKSSMDMHSHEPSLKSISGTRRCIQSMIPDMRMLHTVDCLVSESNKKPVAKYSQAKKLHISGFTGKLTTKGQHKGLKIDKNLLHNMKSIVFVESSKSSSVASALNVTSSNRSSKDQRIPSLDEIHKINIKPIWVHSACAVWAPGVYCIKNQLFGIVKSVRDASDLFCTFCRKPGATIACKHKRNMNFHFLCSIAADLVIDEQTLTARLPK